MLVIPVVIVALGTGLGGFRKWLKLLRMAYNMELLQRVFAGDHQNSEKSARHLMTELVEERTEDAEKATDGGPMFCNSLPGQAVTG